MHRLPSSFLEDTKAKELINHLKTERNLFYVRTQCVPRGKHTTMVIKRQLVKNVQGKIFYLF